MVDILIKFFKSPLAIIIAGVWILIDYLRWKKGRATLKDFLDLLLFTAYHIVAAFICFLFVILNVAILFSAERLYISLLISTILMPVIYIGIWLATRKKSKKAIVIGRIVSIILILSIFYYQWNFPLQYVFKDVDSMKPVREELRGPPL